jgi:predicted restriction endonuclease
MKVLPQWDGSLFMSMVRNMNRHSSEDRGPSPHKPIVLFLAIQRLRETGSSALIYEKEFPLIRALIKSFDSNGSPGADYPFWYLQNDKLFDVSYVPPLRMRKGKEFPPHTSLIQSNAVGKIPFWIEQLLRKDTDLISKALRHISEKCLGFELDALESLYSKLSSKK